MEELNISEWFHQVADQVEETKEQKFDELFEMLTAEFKNVSALQKEAPDLHNKNLCLDRMQKLNEILMMISRKESLVKVKERILEYLEFSLGAYGRNVTVINSKNL